VVANDETGHKEKVDDIKKDEQSELEPD